MARPSVVPFHARSFGSVGDGTVHNTQHQTLEQPRVAQDHQYPKGLGRAGGVLLLLVHRPRVHNELHTTKLNEPKTNRASFSGCYSKRRRTEQTTLIGDAFGAFH